MDIQTNHFKWIGLGVSLLLPSLIYTSSFWFHPSAKPPIEISISLIWVLFLILLLILKYGEKESFSSVGSIRINSDTIGLGLSIMMILFGVAIAFVLVWFKVLHLPMTPEPLWDKILKYSFWTKLLLSITAGVTEETCFRGYGITRLQQLTKNKTVAVILPLLLFAVSHAGYGTFRHVVVAFIMGGILTIFYLKFKNLLANIIGHTLFDFLSLVFYK